MDITTGVGQRPAQFCQSQIQVFSFRRKFCLLYRSRQKLSFSGEAGHIYAQIKPAIQLTQTPGRQEQRQARHRERTVLYRVHVHYFDQFLTEYESRFEREFGFLRPIIKGVVERYLDCGNPRCGFARIRCPSCGEERLVMFSCRSRGFCPSCHSKRLEEWGEWMREELLLDVPHSGFASYFLTMVGGENRHNDARPAIAGKNEIFILAISVLNIMEAVAPKGNPEGLAEGIFFTTRAIQSVLKAFLIVGWA